MNIHQFHHASLYSHSDIYPQNGANIHIFLLFQKFFNCPKSCNFSQTKTKYPQSLSQISKQKPQNFYLFLSKLIYHLQIFLLFHIFRNMIAHTQNLLPIYFQYSLTLSIAYFLVFLIKCSLSIFPRNF